ncbi:hypothetical protein HGA91_01715 [candidate division WWE3 bacterium]|nr:hypothetical protein [candidate division WWE3 bacterium]
MSPLVRTGSFALVVEPGDSGVVFRVYEFVTASGDSLDSTVPPVTHVIAMCDHAEARAFARGCTVDESRPIVVGDIVISLEEPVDMMGSGKWGFAHVVVKKGDRVFPFNYQEAYRLQAMRSQVLAICGRG